MANGLRRVAFFDVDETVLAGKSMVEFLRFWVARNGGDDADFDRVLVDLLAVAAEDGRAEGNRAYYRRFAGVASAELAEAGRRWYALHRRRPDAFVAATARALAGHRAAEDPVVLVSGSCRALLDPLAADVGAAAVLCTGLLVGQDGRLTGEVDQPMIGRAKVNAAEELLDRLGVDPAHCFAYGDHATDLDLLAAVGNPRVVGADPVLASWARRHRWPVLPT
jgi:HAD superfamily hydrolase (TIGR01490 family)